MSTTDLDPAFFLPGQEYTATASCHGPWSDAQQHGGPPSALLTRALEGSAPEGGHLAAVRIDFLRPVPVGPVAVHAEVARGGRQVQLLRAQLAVDGRPAALATGWWRRRSPGLIPAVAPDAPTLPAPDTLTGAVPDSDLTHALHRGFIAAVEWRYAGGRLEEPGPSTVWARPRIPLLAGEQTSPTQQALMLADAGSGVSAALDFRTHLFTNLDLGVTLLRPPSGTWLSLHATTALDDAGGGTTTTLLGDERGRLGVAVQTLFVAPRESLASRR